MHYYVGVLLATQKPKEQFRSTQICAPAVLLLFKIHLTIKSVTLYSICPGQRFVISEAADGVRNVT